MDFQNQFHQGTPLLSCLFLLTLRLAFFLCFLFSFFLINKHTENQQRRKKQKKLFFHSNDLNDGIIKFLIWFVFVVDGFIKTNRFQPSTFFIRKDKKVKKKKKKKRKQRERDAEKQKNNKTSKYKKTKGKQKKKPKKKVILLFEKKKLKYRFKCLRTYPCQLN